MPPLAFAVHRYAIASTLLVTFAALGFLVVQGLWYVGLLRLPAVSVSFILNFNPVFVLALSVAFLRELPSKL